MKLKLILLCIACVLSACVDTNQTKPSSSSTENGASSSEQPKKVYTFTPIVYEYKDTRTPAWNFQANLNNLFFQCRLKADMAQTAFKYNSDGFTQIKQALDDCMEYGYKESDEAIITFKQSQPSEKTLDLSKDLYSKWKIYFTSLSPYSALDANAKREYEFARETLITEERF